MAVVNKTRYALLGVLSISSGSGYDIKKMCDASISHFWNENFSHIYPVLKQLESEGLVTSRVEREGSRPEKTVYSITDLGRMTLSEWLSVPVEHYPSRSELLLKLFFSREVPVETTLNMLRQEKEKEEKTITGYRQIENQLKASQEISENEGLPYWLSTVRLGRYDSEAKVNWLQETIELFEKLGEKKTKN